MAARESRKIGARAQAVAAVPAPWIPTAREERRPARAARVPSHAGPAPAKRQAGQEPASPPFELRQIAIHQGATPPPAPLAAPVHSRAQAHARTDDVARPAPPSKPPAVDPGVRHDVPRPHVASDPRHPAHELTPHEAPATPREGLTAPPNAATAASDAYGGIFTRLIGMADSLGIAVAASRALAPPPAPRERENASTLDWASRLEVAMAATREIARSAAAARDAVAAVRERPEAAGALPMRDEARRLGQAARVAGALLAAVRAARAVERPPPPLALRARVFGDRILGRAATLEAILARLEGAGAPAGEVVVGGAVDAARAEVEEFYGGLADGTRRMQAAGTPGLFAASRAVGAATEHAVPEGAAAGADPVHTVPGTGAAARAGAPAPSVGGRSAGAGAEALLDRAAALTASSAGDAIVEAVPPPGGTERPEVPEPAARRVAAPSPALVQEQARAVKVETDTRRERPAKWEHYVPESVTVVGVDAIARALGVLRAEDVRDVLLNGQREQHQFVLWARVTARLSSELQALVTQGLVETRVLAP